MSLADNYNIIGLNQFISSLMFTFRKFILSRKYKNTFV